MLKSITNKIDKTFFLMILGWVLFTLVFYQIKEQATYFRIEKISSALEFFLEIASTLISWKIYSKTDSNFKKYYLFLFLSFVFLMITDIGFYLVFYILKMDSPSNIYGSLYELPFLLFLLCQMALWIGVTNHNIFSGLNKLYLSLFFLVLSFLEISIFLMAATWKISFFSYLGIYDILTAVLEFLIIDLVILILICSKNKSLNIIATGTIVIIATNLWEKYLFDSGMLGAFDYSDVFWLLGQIMLFFGLLYSYSNASYNSILTNSLKKIKSQISLWIFSVMILSFLVLFFIGYSVGLINKDSLMSLPFLMVIYAVIVVLLSNYIGSRFEQPFEKLKNDIEVLTSPTYEDSDLSQDLATEEFVFLQKFIVNAFKSQNSRNKEKKAVADMALQVAHDIRSPVSAILMLSKTCIEIPENQRIALRDAANRILDIANYLLSQYGNKIAENEEVVSFLASTAVLSVISEKRVEYRNLPITFTYDCINESSFSFIKASIVEFKRVVSNIINNAVDAIVGNGEVAVSITNNQDTLTLTITDNGRGMSSDLINKILNNEMIVSNKTSGHGFGLTHARSVLKQCNANFNIHSEINKFTEISLTFNVAAAPVWITNEINFYLDDCIVVLDDDASIHGAWNKFLSTFMDVYPDLRIMHFTNAEKCIEYIKSIPDRNKILLLADYELINQNINGLDVIELTEVDRAILVTSHYENVDIIKRSILLNTQLIPKMLVSCVKLNPLSGIASSDERLEDVNLVVLEDDQAFSEVLSYLYTFKGKTIDVYNNPYHLLKKVKNYPTDTKICLDYSLECPITGVELAKVLHDKGYINLYLATGFQMEQKNLPSYITLLREKIDLLNL